VSDLIQNTCYDVPILCSCLCHSDCGKPCRSKTEQELHAQRTGHSKFHDKTAEAAQPMDIVKEVQQIRQEEKAAEKPSTSAAVDGSASQEGGKVPGILMFVDVIAF
jgi:hypothetical protein